jgi:hypothetical protein
MKNLAILIPTLGLFVTNVALADSHLKAESAKPPEPGEISAPVPEGGTGPSCGPMGYARADRDLAPGRGKRVTGALFLSMGLLTVIPGASMLGWSQHEQNDPAYNANDLHSIKVGGAVATAVGAASILIGIPVLAVGAREGRRAREQRITLAPAVAPTAGGATASLGGRF